MLSGLARLLPREAKNHTREKRGSDSTAAVSQYFVSSFHPCVGDVCRALSESELNPDCRLVTVIVIVTNLCNPLKLVMTKTLFAVRHLLG